MNTVIISSNSHLDTHKYLSSDGRSMRHFDHQDTIHKAFTCESKVAIKTGDSDSFSVVGVDDAITLFNDEYKKKWKEVEGFGGNTQEIMDEVHPLSTYKSEVFISKSYSKKVRKTGNMTNEGWKYHALEDGTYVKIKDAWYLLKKGGEKYLCTEGNRPKWKTKYFTEIKGHICARSGKLEFVEFNPTISPVPKNQEKMLDEIWSKPKYLTLFFFKERCKNGNSYGIEASDYSEAKIIASKEIEEPFIHHKYGHINTCDKIIRQS